MRVSGTVWSPVDLDAGSHLCWPYQDSDRFTGVALRYIADGLMAGERVLCVGEEPIRSALANLDPSHARIEGTSGAALRVEALAEVYGAAGDYRTPQQLLRFYQAAGQQAMADRFTGLRVLADVTGVVLDAAGRQSQLRWEHLADEVMSACDGLTVLCAYNADVVGDDVLREVASVHPLTRADWCDGFGLFFDDGGLVLTGFVDRAGADRLERILQRSHHRPAQLRLDLRGAEFRGDRGIAALGGWAYQLAAGSASLVLTGVSDAFRQQWERSPFAHASNVTLAA